MALFLEPADYPAWSRCPGRPAMEAGMIAPPAPRRLFGATNERLEVGIVTGEKGAIVIAPAVLITENEKSGRERLEVFGASCVEAAIVCLAALIKYSLLHEFETVRAGAPANMDFTPDELYLEGARVTEAGARCLALRDSTEALSHLVAGPIQCDTCRAKNECPEFAIAVVDGFPEEVA